MASRTSPFFQVIPLKNPSHITQHATEESTKASHILKVIKNVIEQGRKIIEVSIDYNQPNGDDVYKVVFETTE